MLYKEGYIGETLFDSALAVVAFLYLWWVSDWNWVIFLVGLVLLAALTMLRNYRYYGREILLDFFRRNGIEVRQG